MAVTSRLLAIYVRMFTFKRNYFLTEVSKIQHFIQAAGCWKQFFFREKLVMPC